MRERGIGRLGPDLDGKLRCERRSFPQLALHTKPPFDQLHELVTDSKPQSRSSVLARNRGVRLGELFEKIVSLLGSYSDPRVRHLEPNPVLTVFQFAVHIQAYGAVIGKFA